MQCHCDEQSEEAIHMAEWTATTLASLAVTIICHSCEGRNPVIAMNKRRAIHKESEDDELVKSKDNHLTIRTTNSKTLFMFIVIKSLI